MSFREEVSSLTIYPGLTTNDLLRMVPIAAYYLGVTPVAQAHSGSFTRPQSMSQASVPRSPTSPSPNQPRSPSYRSSMPPASRTTPPDNSSTFVNQPHSPATPEAKLKSNSFEPTVEAEELEEVPLERTTSADSKRKSRSGTMNKEFKFPSPVNSPAIPDMPSLEGVLSSTASEQGVQPSNIEVPPPPPVEKERVRSDSVDDGEDDVGDTVDIPLN